MNLLTQYWYLALPLLAEIILYLLLVFSMLYLRHIHRAHPNPSELPTPIWFSALGLIVTLYHFPLIVITPLRDDKIVPPWVMYLATPVVYTLVLLVITLGIQFLGS